MRLQPRKPVWVLVGLAMLARQPVAATAGDWRESVMLHSSRVEYGEAADANAEEKQPKFAFKFRKDSDSAETIQQNGGVIFQIDSPGGIGSVDITLVEGQWPDQVVLHLNLKYLESISVNNGQLRLDSALGRPDGPEVYQKVENGRWTEVQNNGNYLMPIEKKQEFIEVVLPAVIHSKDAAVLQASWIDAYRN